MHNCFDLSPQDTGPMSHVPCAPPGQVARWSDEGRHGPAALHSSAQRLALTALRCLGAATTDAWALAKGKVGEV